MSVTINNYCYSSTTASKKKTGGGPPPTPSKESAPSLKKVTDGRIALLGPPETKNLAGDAHADEGSSTQNLSSMSVEELQKVHLLRQIKKTDMDMDLIQLQLEEKKLANKKAELEIELLEHRLKDMKK